MSIQTGSLICDAHRTLLYGGILMNPLCIVNGEYKLDVSIIDAFVIGYIFEKAWGRASYGEGGSIMQIKMGSLQQKIQFFCGSASEIVELENLYLSIARRQSLNKSQLNLKFPTLNSIAMIQSQEQSNSSIKW
ncbi:hypothetical protein IMG5_109050 [Ichthyophthirius multifiliis]|uniref:D-fructose-1,6-bisphosphate 1-phosphohydrolase n=1 Tax=Ichthyophthirius multifiliis TaxID=5932 RepID=G0QTK5_ICHMU|nr:hypothetical protein IMG5_109050 [Ichthyophthirius multifiliis]EGR31456.1 hypothetical protein IMG5_109050 [Ichthyophthirius multifiliis]|eukprot:XP_004034942.1 hypothetical protein IMG5_109050 [Ichthyophthirius multifiliis]